VESRVFLLTLWRQLPWPDRRLHRVLQQELTSDRDELQNEEIFDTIDDARRKLSLWRYGYNHDRPHSWLQNQTPAEAR